MPAVRLSPVLRFSWRVHRWILRLSRGRLAAKLGELPVLLLETTGRTSGHPRRDGLSFLPNERGYLVVASYAGEDRDPAWALNLRATSKATVIADGRTTAVVGHELEGEEREAAFARFAALEPASSEYEQRTDLAIPVFELRRAAG